MGKLVAVLILPLLLVTQLAAADQTMIVVIDADGAAGRVGAPVSVNVNLEKMLGNQAKSEQLQLVERSDAADRKGQPVPAQFVPQTKGSSKGELWWLMPPGPKGERRFRLTSEGQTTLAALRARFDKERKLVDVTEGTLPVLRYNHGTVPPPPEIVERFERGREHPLYYARGDYIHPLFGPNGEELTDDYSLDHPHHRGVFWAWPVLRWKGEVRDFWAIRVLATQPGGVWARPVAMRRVLAGPVLAVIDAENVWKWGDKDPIVREEVIIRAFGARDRCRFVDVEVRLTALTDEVSIGGRPPWGTGGFTMRTFPEFDQRNIDMHIDLPQTQPRRAWFHLTGNFPGGKGPAGVAMFEHVTNPSYPNYPNPQGLDGIPDKYPPWRSVVSGFPGAQEVALPKGKPLVMKHRLWIHPGASNKATLVDVWSAYASPPDVRIEE